jgi:hypothetical protein
MAVNGQTSEIKRSDVAEVGDRFAVPGRSDIIDHVLDTVARWPSFAREAGVPKQRPKRLPSISSTGLRIFAKDLRPRSTPKLRFRSWRTISSTKAYSVLRHQFELCIEFEREVGTIRSRNLS